MNAENINYILKQVNQEAKTVIITLSTGRIVMIDYTNDEDCNFDVIQENMLQILSFGKLIFIPLSNILCIEVEYEDDYKHQINW